MILTELALLGVTHLPVSQTPIGLRGASLPTPPTPWRLGYGYEPPAPDLLDWLTSHGAQLVQLPLQDSPAIASSQVDVTLRHDEGSIVSYGVLVAYDPQLERSRQVALAVGKVIESYPNRSSRAFPEAIADEPLSFHLFFGILLPLLLVTACAMGVLAARSRGIRGKFGAGLAQVAGLLVLLTIQLPDIEFPGNEATSSSMYAVGLIVLIPIVLVIASPLSLAMASWRSAPAPRVWWLVAGCCVTAAFFLLVTTSLFDHTVSAWPLSRISGWLTLCGLLVFGCLTAVIARRQGAAI